MPSATTVSWNAAPSRTTASATLRAFGSSAMPVTKETAAYMAASAC
jgi:hypothetical protein